MLDHCLALCHAIGNFSDISRFQCAGCNDGYFAQYLVRNRGWTYGRLPVDGLRSLLFHGPSPTHCIAAGNVWFDHPDVSGVGCVSHEAVQKLWNHDTSRPRDEQLFDWEHYTHSSRICLRVNKRGFLTIGEIYYVLCVSVCYFTVQRFVALSVGTGRIQRRLSDHQSEPDSESRALVPYNASSSGDRQQTSRRRLRSLWADAPGCDAKTYLAANPALREVLTEASAMEHYEKHGREEGRECGFDWKGYVALNPDLPKRYRTKERAWEHYILEGMKKGRVWRNPPGFDWLAYIETSHDLYEAHFSTQGDATRHYTSSGRREGRNIRPVEPTPASYAAALAKFQRYFQNSSTPLAQRNLVIYHVEDIGINDNAFDLTVNNLKVFLAALLHHVESASAEQHAFYWFNVAALTDNPMKALLPTHLPNVAAADWVYSSSAFNSFIHTLPRVAEVATVLVSAVFASSTGVRGPLLQFEDGMWLAEYRQLLDAHDVGLVGPIINCEGTPHVQNHMFAIRAAAIPAVVQELQNYNNIKTYVPIEDYFREHLTTAVMTANFRVAALNEARRAGRGYFSGECIVPPGPVTSKCRVDPKEVLFLRWSGESQGGKGFLCGKGIAMTERNAHEVRSYSRAVAASILPSGKKLPPSLLPELPEARTGWQMHEEFSHEAALRPTHSSTAETALREHVCFWVQVGRGHDATQTKVATHDGTVAKYVQDLIRSKDPLMMTPRTG